MFNAKMRDDVVYNFASEVERVAETMRNLHKVKTYLDAGADSYVRDNLHTINDFIAGCLPKGIVTDVLTVGASVSGNAINMTIKTKKSDAAIPMRVKKTVVRRSNSTDNTMYDDCVTAIYSVYEMMLLLSMAQQNIDKVNEVLADLLKRANLDYTVRLVSYYGKPEDKKIEYLSNDEVVFVCDRENIFGCHNLAVFRDPDALLSEEDIEKAKNNLADEMSVAQTTIQFVQNKGFTLINHLCAIPKMKKMPGYMKKIVSKNVMSNMSRSDGLMYYLEGNTFAIVDVKDGEAEVVLSPCDLETFRFLDDVDVLSLIK